jgi:Family of unknown function (DUF5372)
VYYRDRTGRMRFLPVRWTTMSTPDPFVLIAEGRAYFRLADLIRLQDQLRELQGSNISAGDPGVKQNMPDVLRK